MKKSKVTSYTSRVILSQTRKCNMRLVTFVTMTSNPFFWNV